MFKKLFTFLFFLQAELTFGQTLNYGVSANLNYTTAGATNIDFAGRGLYSFGAFISTPYSKYHTSRFLNRLEFLFEPSISFLSFREVQNDTRYNNNYLDAGIYTYVYPEKMSGDIKLLFGLKPSVLINHSTEIIDFGVYRPKVNDPSNFNRNGDVDLQAAIGISISMGEVVKSELKYQHSFTNYNKPNYIKGRQSAIEIGIRLSATDVIYKYAKVEQGIVSKVKNLQKGTLLVMLSTITEKEKNYILQIGNLKDLEMHQLSVEQANKNVIQAFRQVYSFCKVLFFMDTCAYKVNAGIFNNVFVNERFETILNPDFDTTHFYIASFTEDVSAFTQKVDYGLHIFDKNFNALPKPFLSKENYFGVNFGGDPVNFFSKKKLYYYPQDYIKIVKRFNNRMEKAALIHKK